MRVIAYLSQLEWRPKTMSWPYIHQMPSIFAVILYCLTGTIFDGSNGVWAHHMSFITTILYYRLHTAKLAVALTCQSRLKLLIWNQSFSVAATHYTFSNLHNAINCLMESFHLKWNGLHSKRVSLFDFRLNSKFKNKKNIQRQLSKLIFDMLLIACDL